MATRKAKLAFTIQRFKGFWKQFNKSKRGMLGLGIVVFFVLVAILAPVIAQYDPIRPMEDIGQYPGYGPGFGRKIASPLSYPVWYKYLPNVPKGEVEVSEEFYTIVYYVPEYKRYFPLYGKVGVTNVTDAYLLLDRRVAVLRGITATFPENQTTVPIPPSDYIIRPNDPRTIRLKNIYPNFTRFEVKYTTGVDIVENMEVIQDPLFTSNSSINEWVLSSSEGFSLVYNAEKGFDNDGCLELSYTPSGTPPATVQATLSRSFKYPYWEPPRQILIHFSLRYEGNQTGTIKFLISAEDKPEPFLLKTYQLSTPSTSYKHSYFDTSDPEVKVNVGTKAEPAQNPLDIIFAYPSNYLFSMQITLQNPDESTKVYIDNFHCVVYGNAFGLLGTDSGVYGFPLDIFSTLVYGTRVSLIVGVLSAVFSTLIGLFLGLISGYIGGIVDEGIMRFADLLLVLPTLPLFIVLIVALRAIGTFMSIWNIIIIITLFGWMGFARSVRSMVVSLRERAFVEAAKASGAGTMHIINRHILPNVFALVYITLATSVPGAIILEASLSWLGLGDPLVASWGKLLYDFQTVGIALTKGLGEYWYWVFPPCIAIALLATAFILMGYAFDEILNPRLRERK
ncbi:MAG: ABC transporter permease [Thermoproteota archaeon]